jgi:chorismate-pyruvate lyase
MRHKTLIPKIAGGIWQTMPPAHASLLQKSWLCGAGSLTKKLEYAWACKTGSVARLDAAHKLYTPCKLSTEVGCQVEVQIIYEGVQTSWADEAVCLGIGAREPVWVREVVLRIGGKAAVVARSTTALSASYTLWRKLRFLHTAPLGSWLYKDRTINRSHFAYATLSATHPLTDLVRRNVISLSTLHSPVSFLARRSLFTQKVRVPSRHLPTGLLVTECLLEQAFI